MKEINIKNILDFVNEKLGNHYCLLFFAEWCNQCKPQELIFQTVEEDYPMIRFYKINYDENIDLSHLFQVNSVPCSLFIRLDDGLIVEKKLNGLKTEYEIEVEIEKWLK